jgi:raffinose/stachyose/melibiose transport system permease protein
MQKIFYLQAVIRKIYRSKIISIVILINYTIITLIPLWFLFNNAFKKSDYIFKNPFYITLESFTFDSVIRAFYVMKYPQAILNNIIYLTLSSIMIILFASLAGFSIIYSGSKILEKYYLFSVMIITLPFQIAMVPLVNILKNLMLYNTYFGLSLVFTAFSLPIAIFLYTGYIRLLPKELYEAATIDGCGMIRTYSLVYMPLLQSVTATVLILRGIFVWNDLLIPLVLLSNSKLAPLSLRLYSFVSPRFNSWDLIFAGTLLTSIPIAILYLILQKYFIEGVTTGAVKG